MGSVQSFIECPNCKGQELSEDFYYKTGEFYKMCGDCGYFHRAVYKRGEDGKFLKVDNEKDFTFDNLIPEETIIDKPYCAFKIEFPKMAECGCLATEEEYQKFVSDIVSLTNQPNDICKVTIKRFVDGKHTSEDIYEKTSN